MVDSAELFEAISHPVRIKILKILEKQPASFAYLKRQQRVPAYYAFLTITTSFFGFSIGTIATSILLGLLPVVGGTLALVSMRKIRD